MLVFYRLSYIYQTYIIRLSIDFLDFCFIYRNILAKVMILFFHIRVKLFVSQGNIIRKNPILQVIDPNLDALYQIIYILTHRFLLCTLYGPDYFATKFVLYFYVRCCMFTLTYVILFLSFQTLPLNFRRPHFQDLFLYVCFLVRLSHLMLLDAIWRRIIHKIMPIAIAFILNSKAHTSVYFNPKPVLPIDQPIDTYTLQLFKLHSVSSSAVLLVFMPPLGHSL